MPALRPRVRIPWWAAVTVVAAAYLVRAAMRGDIRPEWPFDALVLGGLAALLALQALLDRARQDGDGDGRDRGDGEGAGGPQGPPAP